MDIVLLANRLRLEERQLIEALTAAGYNATLKTPEEITTAGLTSSGNGQAGLLISRLPAGAEAEAFASVFEAQGWLTLPSSDDLALFSDRAQFLHAMQVVQLPNPRTLVASGHDAILEAAEALGYPVEVLPLDAARPAFTAGDADTAEALVEHRIALGGERTMLVRLAQSAHQVRRLLVIGEEVFASTPGEDGVDTPDDVTEADIALVERLFEGKSASAWAIDVTTDGYVLSIGPVERFRDLQRAGLDITGAFTRLVEDRAGAPVEMAPEIDPANVAELLTGLVSIPSISGQEGAASSWLVEQMSALGFEAGVDPAGNAVGTRGHGPIEIMLLGHIDTVPGDIPVWVEDDILHGRGSVDAKGPLATFVVAASRAEFPPDVRFTVVGATGEESFGSPGATWLRDNHPAPAAVVIGEPSGWDSVVLGYKGSIGFTARIEREITHSAGPDATAPETMFRFWAAISSWLDHENEGIEPGFNSLDATIRGFDSGGDGLHEVAEMMVTFRIPPGTMSNDVRERASEIASTYGVDLQWVFNAEAYRIQRSSPIVAPFTAAIRDSGAKARFKVKTGTADMNIVGPAWGCPMLAYGPGDASYDHRPDEQISLAEVEKAADILTGALERFATKLAGKAAVVPGITGD